MKKLSYKACSNLRLASEALLRASQAAREAGPTVLDDQDDDLAAAVFAEITAAEALIKRAVR